ncbi:MAG: hypothetical protein ACRDTG_25910 [Pseudonocardiaceae bacterium]
MASQSSGLSRDPHRWEWRKGENPYRYTAFGVLGFGPEALSRRMVAALVKKRLQRVRFGVQTLFGRPLREAEIHDAERRLQDPAQRLLEELCTHRPHPARVQTDDLAARLAQLRVPASGDSPPIVLDRNALLELVPPPYPRTFPPLADR